MSTNIFTVPVSPEQRAAFDALTAKEHRLLTRLEVIRDFLRDTHPAHVYREITLQALESETEGLLARVAATLDGFLSATSFPLHVSGRWWMGCPEPDCDWQICRVSRRFVKQLAQFHQQSAHQTLGVLS